MKGRDSRRWVVYSRKTITQHGVGAQVQGEEEDLIADLNGSPIVADAAAEDAAEAMAWRPAETILATVQRLLYSCIVGFRLRCI